jgi:peptidyl-prolyl cis-trans isomerase C
MADEFAGLRLLGPTIRRAAILLLAPLMLAQVQPASAQSRPGASAADASSLVSGGLYNPGDAFRKLVNPIVADIDGTPITLSDIGDAIRGLPRSTRQLPFDQLYPYVLDHLIQERALVMKARRAHLDQDPVVKRHLQEATDKVLEDEVLNRMLDNVASEEALLARYQKLYQDKPGPEEVQVGVILTPTEEKARAIIKELAGGADFATVAKRDSLDPTRKDGGDLGFRRLEELAPLVAGAAFALEPGQIAPNPIHAPSGWFVIKSEARRRADTPSFPEVREQLRHEILMEDVSRVAREVVAGADVHRFNINGSPMGGADANPDDTTRQ